MEAINWEEKYHELVKGLMDIVYYNYSDSKLESLMSRIECAASDIGIMKNYY